MHCVLLWDWPQYEHILWFGCLVLISYSWKSGLGWLYIEQKHPAPGNTQQWLEDQRVQASSWKQRLLGGKGWSRVESKEVRDWKARDTTGKAANAQARRVPESHPELSASAVKKGSTTVTASRVPGLQFAAWATDAAPLILKTVALRENVQMPRTQNFYQRGSCNLPFYDFHPNPETPLCQLRNFEIVFPIFETFENVYSFHFIFSLSQHSLCQSLLTQQKTRSKGRVPRRWF